MVRPCNSTLLCQFSEQKKPDKETLFTKRKNARQKSTCDVSCALAVNRAVMSANVYKQWQWHK